MYTFGQDKAKVGIVSIDKRGDSYRVRFTYPKGKRHQFTVANATPEGWVTAIKAAQLINRDIDLGDFDESYGRYSPKHAHSLEAAKEEKTKQYNLKELWEIYKESNKNRVAKTTQDNHWRQFDTFLSNTPVEAYSLTRAEIFVNVITSKYALSTIAATFRTCLHPSINQAVKKGLITVNPYVEIELPKVQKKAPECFEPDEVKAIIAAFYNDTYVNKFSKTKHSYYAPMVEFLALTGCRPEEAHALTWDDIKYKKDKVFISFNKVYSKGVLLNHTKTHTIRLFPCNEQLKKLIGSIPKNRNEYNLVFPSTELRYVDQGNFRNRYYAKVVKGLVKDGKVHKYLKPYCLRHSFITRLIREGVDIATVAALSGNSPEVIMTNYLASRKEFDLPPL